MGKIRVKLVGGVGNQLFGYFAGKAHSLLFQKQLILQTRDVNSSLLSKEVISSLNLDGEFVHNQISWDFMKKINPWAFSSNVLGYEVEILMRKNIGYMSGYFQTYKYFEICRTFYPDLNPMVFKPSLFFSQVKGEIEELQPITIHVRRGDYRKLKDHFGLISFEFYMNCIQDALAKHGSRSVYIFGDEIKECKTFESKLESSGIRAKVISPPNATLSLESMLLMSIAPINIIGNSTFGWWGAMFNKEPLSTYAPSKWFKSADDPEHLIPPNWIRTPSSWES